MTVLSVSDVLEVVVERPRGVTVAGICTALKDRAASKAMFVDPVEVSDALVALAAAGHVRCEGRAPDGPSLWFSASDASADPFPPSRTPGDTPSPKIYSEMGVDTSPAGFAVSVATDAGPIIIDVRVPAWGDSATDADVADAVDLCLSMALVLTDISRRTPGFEVDRTHLLDHAASVRMISGMGHAGRTAELARVAVEAEMSAREAALIHVFTWAELARGASWR